MSDEFSERLKRFAAKAARDAELAAEKEAKKKAGAQSEAVKWSELAKRHQEEILLPAISRAQKALESAPFVLKQTDNSMSSPVLSFYIQPKETHSSRAISTSRKPAKTLDFNYMEPGKVTLGSRALKVEVMPIAAANILRVERAIEEFLEFSAKPQFPDA
jgi:hypothetical protein